MIDIEDYKTIKFNKNEIKLIKIAITERIIKNKTKLEELGEKDTVAYSCISRENDDYKRIYDILEYLER